MKKTTEGKKGVKTCITCGVEKELDEFGLRADNGKIKGSCRECTKGYHRKWLEKNFGENREKANQRGLDYNRKNKTEISIRMKKYYEKNREEIRDRRRKAYKENRDENIKKSRERYQKIKDTKEFKESRRKSCKKQYIKMLKDPHKKLKRRMGISVYQKLKNRGLGKKGRSSFCDILPYGVEDLFNHLESLFEPGMTWENYGKGLGKWNIDHVVPDSWFNYEDVENKGFKQSWALKNLQPMWSIENASKCNRYSGKKEKKNG